MRARMRFGAALVAVALAGGLAVEAAAAPVQAPAQPPGSAGDSGVGRDVDLTRDGAHPRLSSSLVDDLEAGRPMSPAAEAPGATDPAAADRVTVMVEAGSAEEAAAAVAAVGGTTSIRLEGEVQADVPAARLDDLAAAPGVDFVREPLLLRPDVTSEGVATTAASSWQTAGWEGQGTDVAIVDVGFAGYAARLGTELPADATTTDFTRCGGTGSSSHGTAVAEIVHDMAPGATLHLVCVQTEADFVNALGTLPGLGIDVVNGSIGLVGSTRSDGSGGSNTAQGAVRTLRSQGILYVASAGNYGGSHWHGNAVGDAPSQPNVNLTDLVNVTADDELAFAVPEGATFQVTVMWDSWVGTKPDFDVYVYNPSCAPLSNLLASEEDQTAIPALRPLEVITFQDCPGNSQTYWIWVNRYSGTATPRMDIFVDSDMGVGFEPGAATASNLGEPATSPAALAVGSHCYSTPNAVQPYSSQGPTIDGRIKPDISGPDANSSSVYGAASGCSEGFTGTSAAAPHVAGAAALVRGRNPSIDVAELQQHLLDRAVDRGAAGDDSVFGAGSLTVGTFDLGTSGVTPTPQPFTSIAPVRLLDTRAGQQGLSESPDRTTPLGAGTGQMIALQVRGGATGVPADAVAVVLNLTVTGSTMGSFVTVQPGTNKPTTSNLNFGRGQVRAQHVTATVASDGRVRIYNELGTTHVIVDIAGWYGPTGSGGGATERFNALPAPRRALDTRAADGYAEVPTPRDTPLVGGVPFELTIEGGSGGVPTGATAAILNVTVTGPTQGGHITVFPGDESLPVASNVNFSPGLTVANLVVARLGADGEIAMQLYSGTAHVVVDVVGWFEPGVGAGYIPLDPPVRQLDTRRGTGLRFGAIGSQGTHNQDVGLYQGVPLDAEAAILGVAAIAPTTDGFLIVYPAGAARPTASNVNFTRGAVVPNAVVAGLGTLGRVSFFNSSGATHVLSDVAGYFLDPANVPVPLGTPPS